MTNVKQWVLGRRLDTKEAPHQTVSKPVGLAVFASDAISSTAYATEEILLILSLAVTGGATMWITSGSILGLSIPIAFAIAVLLVIVTVSYRQTIYAYPNGGGAYIVARDNFGELMAQIAGAALLTDYILTVAVSTSSGVAQITSAIPALQPHRVTIAVAVIVFIMIVNLRGVKESGRLFAIPTYFFVFMMGFTLVVGFIQYLSGTLPTVVDVEAVEHTVLEPLGLFLVLKAFSSGCTALTGIEAISNGIPAFKQPRSRNAAVTLAWMSSILVTLFISITLIANKIQALPSEHETIISQIGRTIFGDSSILYFLLMAGTALILLMAANTSFADFPRLAALAASDRFLPRQFAFRGGRLVFSTGIMALALFAIALVILTGARTTALIPLYAIGVFLSFTISQSGMVVHLWRLRHLKPGEFMKGLEADLHYDRHWKIRMVISAIGAVCTFIVMMVFAITKFTGGAWFVLVLIPLLVLLFFRIHRHYKDVATALSLGGVPIDVHKRSMRTIILVDDVHAGTVRMVNFAKSMGHPWLAVHINTNPEKAELVEAKWQKRIGEGQLVLIPSPYRLLSEPLKEYLMTIREEEPDGFIHLIMGQLVMDTYWEQALHSNSTFLLNVAVSELERVAITSVPYQIHHVHEHLVGEDEQRHEAVLTAEARGQRP